MIINPVLHIQGCQAAAWRAIYTGDPAEDMKNLVGSKANEVFGSVQRANGGLLSSSWKSEVAPGVCTEVADFKKSSCHEHPLQYDLWAIFSNLPCIAQTRINRSLPLNLYEQRLKTLFVRVKPLKLIELSDLAAFPRTTLIRFKTAHHTSAGSFS
ncbi:MAG: hypothetical protein WBP94_04050 [Rhodomicrobiaceae bacterium]